MTTLAIVAGFILPFFNIPLILKVWRMKSSKEISLVWVFGVWVCQLLMLPQMVLTSDLSYKIFGFTNFVLFTFVVAVVYRYRSE